MSDHCCENVWFLCPNHMGGYASVEEKVITHLQCEANDKHFATFIASTEAKRLAMLAKHVGAGRYLPDWLKDAAKKVCEVAPYADQLPPVAQLEFVKLAAKVTQTVCQIFGE